PPGIVALEGGKAGVIAIACGQKVLRRLAEQRQLVGFYFVKIDAGMRWRLRLKLRLVQPAAFHQPLQADEQRVPGKGRDRRIRGMSHARWGKRQYLPNTQARAPQEVSKGVCFRAKVSNPTPRGQ